MQNSVISHNLYKKYNLQQKHEDHSIVFLVSSVQYMLLSAFLPNFAGKSK